MGGDSLAAAVSQSFPVVLFLYSADTPQDAAGCLPATGSMMLSSLALSYYGYSNYDLITSWSEDYFYSMCLSFCSKKQERH